MTTQKGWVVISHFFLTDGTRKSLGCITGWSRIGFNLSAEEKDGHLNCSTPYVPNHARIQDPRLNYQFRDRVTVTCDADQSSFTLQCHNKGLWSGPDVSCPVPPPSPSKVLSCNAPVVPPYATIGNFRLSYKPGDRLNVTCDIRGEPVTLECDDGLWTGQNVVCDSPAPACSPPNIPSISYIEAVKPRYKNGDQVNITCNDNSEQFVWECQEDGLWRGRYITCAFNVTPIAGPNPGPPAPIRNPPKEVSGREYFITGLLVVAVILFVLVLMSLAMFFIFVRNRGYGLASSSKEALSEKARGPLPDVPEGYANYVAGEQSLYVEPYLKQNGDPNPSYEVYEKPV
nr:uncharacterized protein LOC129282853 [Lytechinus pictus]